MIPSVVNGQEFDITSVDRKIVSHIHDSEWNISVAMSGGGVGFIHKLLSTVGASRTVIDVAIPYSAAALRRYLGYCPEAYCSVETASDLAVAAYASAVKLPGIDGHKLLGVGITAALATDRSRQGGDRCHISIAGPDINICRSIEFKLGDNDRDKQDSIVSKLALLTVTEALQLNSDDSVLELASQFHDEYLGKEGPNIEHWLSGLLEGRLDVLAQSVEGHIGVINSSPRALLSGSFDPLHAGHKQLAAVASDTLDTNVDFELSVINVDKPPLGNTVISERMNSFCGYARIFLTRAPTFREKARLFPGTTFVVGIDTAIRLIDSVYYTDTMDMRLALKEINEQGCGFLVAGRSLKDGFLGIGDISIPSEFSDMFTGIAESEFRNDISSTDIRNLRS
tara:strand:+ start:1055 stop:2242 length:1188 start_codon:yes stop_codon:yes gene_type:complete